MKKRVLSFLLAAVMLMLAVPATLLTGFAAEAPETEYTAEDYNALYVQDKLVYAIDFMSTNAYWGGAAYSSASEGRDAGQTKLNSFAYKTYLTGKDALVFNGVGTGKINGVEVNLKEAEIVKIANGAFSTDDIYSIVVSTAGTAMGDAYQGATLEMVSIIKSQGAKGGNSIMVNDHRIPSSAASGKQTITSIELQSAVVGMLDSEPKAVDGAPLALPHDELFTFTFTMKRPTDTQSYYTYSYADNGAYYPADVKDFPKDGSAGSFYITHKAIYEGDELVGVEQLSDAEILASKSMYYLIKPIYTEYQGVKYITGAIAREVAEANGQDGGEGGPLYHDPAVEPGAMAMYQNGAPLYRNDAVAYPNNKKGDATYIRFQNSGPNLDIYAYRLYGKTLTEDEILLNHAADLCKWFRLDIGGYASFSEKDRLLMAAAIRNYDFTSDRDEVAETFFAAYNSIAYDGITNDLTEGTPEYAAAAAFLTLAIDKQLAVAQVKLLPEKLRQQVYVDVCGYAAGHKNASAAEIQKALDDSVVFWVNEEYRDYIIEEDHDYRALYVHQDKLYIAADFFDAKASDGPVYVGPSYDDWLETYDKIEELHKKANGYAALGYASYEEAFRALTKAEFSERHADEEKFAGFATLTEARTWARDARKETTHANEWESLVSKYVWKGTSSTFSTVDIANVTYPHDNVRRYGDGVLYCLRNNSIVLKVDDDTSDLTYQVVGAEVSGSWQLRGFRQNISHSDSATTITNYNYFGLTVTGSEEKPVFNESGLLNYTFPTKPTNMRPTVSRTYSTEITAVVDKTPNAGGQHYYSYKWNGEAYDVNEVQGPGEGVYGPVSYAGLLNLNMYGNGNHLYEMDAPYQPSAPDSIGNSGSNVYYAIRVYKCTLTQEEIWQNHFADLAGLYDLDLTMYHRLDAGEKAALHKALRSVELGMPASTVEEVYNTTVCRYYYTFDTTSENAKTFRALAEEYQLNAETLMAISPASRERVFDIIASDPGVIEGATWFRPQLQGKLEQTVAQVLNDHYAECLGYSVASLKGYQLNLNGERIGMRAVFTLNSDILDKLNTTYNNAINVTVGAMLLPAANAADKVTMDENGTITLPESAFASVEAYKNGATAATSRENGEYVYRLEYFPEMSAVEEEVAFVGYICLRTPEGESVVEHIYYSAGNIADGASFSLYDLTRYANSKYGMAHKNVQAVLNEVDEIEKGTINVGTANLSDFAIYKTNDNAYEIEALQTRVEQFMGVRLQVVTNPTDARYVIYLGHADTIYDESDYYGIAAHGNALLLWYNDDANQEAMLAELDALFAVAKSSEGIYTIHNGTSYVYRSR